MVFETDTVDVVLLSIAGTCARHGLLKVLPYPLQHKTESFGFVARKDRPLSEAAQFFWWSCIGGKNRWLRKMLCI